MLRSTDVKKKKVRLSIPIKYERLSELKNTPLKTSVTLIAVWADSAH